VQRYGYFEMRARIPAGKALWPAFWLLPADKSWPPEIDILEVVGQQADLMVTTTHWTGSDGKRQASGCRTSLPSASSAFHLFGALWTPERIVYYIDREPVAQLATPPGVDKPMYLLLNLAVGGNMVGRADDQTPLPASYDIDWVTAYTLPGHPPCEPRRSAAEVNRCDAR
jgi:beta-glucanase (GH16 family)